jgi:hypothetical protein
MTGDDIIAKVKTLNWPKGSYAVFGSCPMAVAGIRESSDIDFLVTPGLFASLKAAGWKELVKGSNDKPLVFEDFEAHAQWDFSSYKPTLEQLLATATVVDDIPFASLEEVRKWKLASGRPKDLEDIELIDQYLKNK